MGMEEDMIQRKLGVRADNDDRKERVLQARKLIYEKKRAVDNKDVEELLKYDSLVPIAVSSPLITQLI